LRGAYNKEVEQKLSAQKLDFDHTVAQLLADQRQASRRAAA
jgi:hypothetical protein